MAPTEAATATTHEATKSINEHHSRPTEVQVVFWLWSTYKNFFFCSTSFESRDDPTALFLKALGQKVNIFVLHMWTRFLEYLVSILLVSKDPAVNACPDGEEKKKSLFPVIGFSRSQGMELQNASSNSDYPRDPSLPLQQRSANNQIWIPFFPVLNFAVAVRCIIYPLND